MKQQSKIESRKNVLYVSLSSEYLKCFFEMKYGRNGMVFPDLHPIRKILESCLLNNPSMKEITPFCYSEAAFNYEKNAMTDINIITIDKDKREDFISVVIPETVLSGCGICKTSNTWQLTPTGTRKLRREATREFWMDLELFIDQCFVRAQIMGYKVSREGAIDDFMIAYHIPASHRETLVRNEKRQRKNFCQGIEVVREQMENRAGSSFLYT